MNLTTLIKNYRFEMQNGDNATQYFIDKVLHQLSEYRTELCPHETDEMFRLVNDKGQFTELIAPRWLCHLLALRHKVAQVLLRWQSPRLGRVFIIQVRSWKKFDSPGHLDISVGGHITGIENTSALDTALKEMEEELGLTVNDLIDGKLKYKDGYNNVNENEAYNFHDAEWRDLFEADIKTEGFEKIRFNDKEVIGLYLCPETEARNLINQKIIPIANGLRYSLPRMW